MNSLQQLSSSDILTDRNNHNSLKTSHPLSPEQVQRYHEEGFIIIPKFFAPDEIESLQKLLAEDPELKGSWTQRNTNKEGDNFKVSVWTDLGNTLLGVIPRIARMVDATEALLEKR